MRRFAAILGLVVLAGLLWTFAVAEATTVRSLSLTQLLERSDVVVHVRVGEIRIVQRPDAPFRVTRLEVLEPLAGDARVGDTFELWQRGDGRLFILGDPRLQTGEEGVAFLVIEGSRSYLTALAQSWWRFDRGQDPVAYRDLSELTIVETSEATAPNSIRWSVLRSRIRRARVEATR